MGYTMEMTTTQLIKTIKSDLGSKRAWTNGDFVAEVAVWNTDGLDIILDVTLGDETHTYTLVHVDDESTDDNALLARLNTVAQRITKALDEKLPSDVEYNGVLEC